MRRASNLKTSHSILVSLFLLAALAAFMVRGPWRALHSGGGDFSAPYVESVRFKQKLNPYISTEFLSSWHEAGAPQWAVVDLSMQHPVYPPSTLVLIAPFSLMSWHKALAAYVLLCTVLYGYLLYRLAMLIDEGWNSWERTGFVAFGLMLSPIHTAIGVANLSMLAFILCMYSVLAAQERKDIAAGVLLALALCIKPTSGIGILVYTLFCRRWRLISALAGVTSLVFAAAMVRMLQIPPVWKISYRENVAYLFGHDGAANFASPGEAHFDLLNLQVPFFEISHSTRWANSLSWITIGILGAVWMLLILSNRKLLQDSATLSVAVLLGLLPIYQRNYNAGFVLLALLWVFQNFHRPLAKGIIAVSTVFLLPGEALLRVYADHIPLAIRQSMLWNVIVLPQATWAVLSIALLLLAAMATYPRGEFASRKQGIAIANKF